jgi:hypothetical protein
MGRDDCPIVVAAHPPFWGAAGEFARRGVSETAGRRAGEKTLMSASRSP